MSELSRGLGHLPGLPRGVVGQALFSATSFLRAARAGGHPIPQRARGLAGDRTTIAGLALHHLQQAERLTLGVADDRETPTGEIHRGQHLRRSGLDGLP